MSLRDINFKHRTTRRVFHRSLIVALITLFPILWIVLSHVPVEHRIIRPGSSADLVSRGKMGFENAFNSTVGYIILFYVLARVLYWGIYWILQAFEGQPIKPTWFQRMRRLLRHILVGTELNDEEDYSSTYMLRIVKQSGYGSREIHASTFRANNLDKAKKQCIKQARNVLGSDKRNHEWEEFDVGFFIQHGRMRVELLIDLSHIKLPDSDGCSPIRA